MNCQPASLAAATVLGFGAVTPLGRDVTQVAQRLAAPPAAPAGSPRRVADELLTDPATARRLRRADRLVRMAVLAASDAWAAAKLLAGDAPTEQTGIIVATGLGPHARTFKFLDGILDCGDNAALPVDFSHSVHNAAAAYVAELLDLRGPSCTVTDFECGFEQAVLLAQCWLAGGTCERVIVGAVEELGDVMLALLPRVLDEQGGAAEVSPGEGAVFLVLAPVGVSGLARLDATATPRRVGVLVEEGLPGSAPGLLADGIDAAQRRSFAPWFGHIASGSAVALLGTLLSPAPLPDGAMTAKRLSDGRTARLLLTR